MSKEEILQGLKAARLWDKAEPNSYWWQKAFEEYNIATGSKLRPSSCATCSYKKVKKWIES